MLYWVVSGRSLWGWRTSLAPNQAAGLHCQLATQCGHPGLGSRASAETPKVLEVGKGESRSGTSRWGLFVKQGLITMPSLSTGVMTSVEIHGLSLKVPIL